MDLDPQRTASAWLRGCEGSKVLQYESGADYDAVFIDTPPRLDLLPGVIAQCAVAVLVCSPSPADLWTTRDSAKALREHLPARGRLCILFNGVMPNTVLARDLPDLAKRIGVDALKATIARRQCFQHAALMGWGALDQAAREDLYKAALEIVTVRR
jgi:cellulose biosynthesis protein BcsQ